MLKGESPCFSQVAAGNLEFLSSYDRDIRHGVVSGKSSLHASYEGPLGIPLQSLPGSRSSSGAETSTSDFLSSADMNLGVRMELPQGTQASSHVEICKSVLLSSCNNRVRLPVELT